MANYLQSLDKLVEGEDNMLAGIFGVLEAKTGIRRKYLLYGCIALLVLYLIFGYAAQLICNLIGFAYPAYASIKAIESPQKGDDTKWLTYWTVFAFLTVVEFPINVLLSWIPFYWLLKSVFMMWLFSPAVNGSVIIYEKVIKKFYVNYSEQIDGFFTRMADTVSKKLIDAAVKKE